MPAQLLPNVVQKFFDSNGDPLVGGKLYSYQAGTTTPLATYTDETAGTPNANPVILDAAGSASVWLGSSAYKFVLKNSNNVVQWTVDNVSYINPDSVDKTKINADIAGAALAQNGTGAIDVQVDDVTIEINGANELSVKNGSITADSFTAASKLEVVFKNVRDISCPGLIQQIPQCEWSTPTLLDAPAALPPGAASVTKWSPNGEFLAVGSGTSPYIDIYQRSGTVLTKLADPSTLPAGAVYDLSWSPCGDFLAVGHAASPYVTIYQRSGNTFTKLSDPSSLPSPGAGTILSVFLSFSPNSDFLAVSYQLSIPVAKAFKLYERDGITFTDITTASTISGVGFPLGWSRDSSLFAGVDTTTGNIDVYERADAIFSGITGPDTSSLSGGVSGFAFSPNGAFLAVISGSSPYIALYTVTNGAFAQISNPATLPAGGAVCVAWSANSEYLAIGHATTPFITIYQVSGTTFTKIANLSSLPVAEVLSADWTLTKQFLAVASGTTPYIQVYETASAFSSNALLWAREAPNV